MRWFSLLATVSGNESAAAAQTSASDSPATARATPSLDCTTRHPTPPSDVAQTIVSGGMTRTYQLTIPASYTGKTPYALVFGLHPLSVSYQFMPSEVAVVEIDHREAAALPTPHR